MLAVIINRMIVIGPIVMIIVITAICIILLA